MYSNGHPQKPNNPPWPPIQLNTQIFPIMMPPFSGGIYPLMPPSQQPQLFTPVHQLVPQQQQQAQFLEYNNITSNDRNKFSNNRQHPYLNNANRSNFNNQQGFYQTNHAPPKQFRYVKVNQPVSQCNTTDNAGPTPQQNFVNICKNEALPSLLSLKIPAPPPPPVSQYVQQLTSASFFPLTSENSLAPRNETPRPVSQKQISIDDLLKTPSRDSRPAKIAIILRGIPGSGKSYMANLIKIEEEKHGGSKPKILSIDNYFMCEKEKETSSGPFQTKQITMEYEYDKAMDEVYQRSIVKAFKKTVEDGLFSFIIVEMVNERLLHLEDMTTLAESKGFSVYVLEMANDVITCTNRNIHNRSFKEIYEILSKWELLPNHFKKLDVRSLLQDDAIENVEMDDAMNDEDEKTTCENEVEDTESCSVPTTSRWETTADVSEDKLNKLDGIASNKLFKNNSDSNPLSLEDYLDELSSSCKKDSNKKRKHVRWKDFEEEKKTEKIKELGFIVGQTAPEDWKKITGDYKPREDALKTYKYI